MRVTRRQRPSAEIILTPLIDILFIVLLFLVLTATFTDSTSLRLSLPQATTGIRETQQLPGTIRISVDADGALGIDGRPVSLDDLGRLLGNRPLGSLILNGKRELSKAHIRKLAEHFAVDPGALL